MHLPAGALLAQCLLSTSAVLSCGLSLDEHVHSHAGVDTNVSTLKVAGKALVNDHRLAAALPRPTAVAAGSASSDDHSGGSTLSQQLGHELEVAEDLLLRAVPDGFLSRSHQDLHPGGLQRLYSLFRFRVPKNPFHDNQWLLFWILAVLNYGVVGMVCLLLWWYWRESFNTREMVGAKAFTEFILNEYEVDDSHARKDGLFALIKHSVGLARTSSERPEVSSMRATVRELFFEDNKAKVINNGARTLLLTTVVMFLYRSLRLAFSPSCIQPFYLVRVIELCTLVTIGAGCLHCMRRSTPEPPVPHELHHASSSRSLPDPSSRTDLSPRSAGLRRQPTPEPANPDWWPYVLMVAFYFFYLPAITLPPFQWSCCELEMNCAGSALREVKIVRHPGQAPSIQQKIFTEERYIMDSVAEVDCSLQGQTAQQMFMTWLLVLPWIIPSFNLLLLVWAWIWGVYFGWTLLWNLLHMDLSCEEAFPAYQVALRLVLLSATLLIAMRKKASLEKGQELKYRGELRIREEAKNHYDFLKCMMPKHIGMKMISDPEHPPADKIECVSILFVLIEGFDEIAKSYQPNEVLNFLNKQFTQFDRICVHREVTKIESVKEEYVCCVGVLPGDRSASEESGHQSILGHLFQAADDMLNHAKAVSARGSVKFDLKMGLHTGPIVAGVIGQKLPRYRLFGDTINTAARMMQKGEAGHLQFGEATKEHVPDNVKVEDTGLVEMKGKGQVQTYRFGGFVQVRPQDESDDEMGETASVPSTPDSSRPWASRPRISMWLPAKDEGVLEPNPLWEKLSQFSSDLKHGLSDVFEEKKLARASIPDLGKFKEMEELSSTVAKLDDAHFASAEMEEAWYRDHHQKNFVKKLTSKLDKTVALLAVWSLVHASAIVCLKAFLKQISWTTGIVDVTVFLFCRSLQILILVALRQAVTRYPEFQNDPFKFQCTALACYVAVAFMSYMSYQALTYHAETTADSKDFGDIQAPVDQFFTLVFMLEYCILTSRHQFLFKYSLVFIVLAFMLMTVADSLAYRLGMHGGLYFPMMGEFLFVVIAIINSVHAWENENSSRYEYKLQKAHEESQKRIKDILDRLMPTKVLEEMQQHRDLKSHVFSHCFRHATIAQSDLCGFTKLAGKKKPHEVVEFISGIFSQFDEITDRYGIYKIETVGDAYIAGKAEHTLTEDASAYSVVLFGLEMVDVVQAWAKRHRVKINARVGVHHGECIGGVVGTEMRRYHIFGELMSGVEILESTSRDGFVQISKACKEAVENEKSDPEFLQTIPGMADWPNDEALDFIMTERTDIENDLLTTSKGEKFSIDEVGGKTFLVTA